MAYNLFPQVDFQQLDLDGFALKIADNARKIAEEEAARIAEDERLNQRIDDEEAARIGADNSLSNRIDSLDNTMSEMGEKFDRLTVFSANKDGIVPRPGSAKANENFVLAGNGEWVTNAGGEGGGSVVSVEQTVTSGREIAKIFVDGDPTSIYCPGGSEGGSDVTVTPILTRGEHIATITVDGVDSQLYAPTGGGSSVGGYNKVQLFKWTAEHDEKLGPRISRVQTWDYTFPEGYYIPIFARNRENNAPLYVGYWAPDEVLNNNGLNPTTLSLRLASNIDSGTAAGTPQAFFIRFYNEEG